MKTNIITAALVSTALVAPLIYLESRYGMQNYSAFPYPLFTILWAVAAAFILAAAPVVKAIGTGENALHRPALLALRGIFLFIAAIFWIGLVNDQMPCFLGVPNCD